MRDLSILLLITGFAGLAFYRPWLGVLGLAVVAYLQPHAYAAGAVREFPAFAVLFACCVASTGVAIWRGRLPIPRPHPDWRLVVILLLWAYFALTTIQAQVPADAGPKLSELSKVFAGVALTLVLIDTREKLFYLLVTMATSIGLVTIKGGYWAILRGFSDRVYGPPGSHFHDNNHFAILVLMNIPLILLWLRENRNPALAWVLRAVLLLSAAAALSSWSRGGMIAFAVTSLVLIWYSRRRALAAAGALAVAAFALVGLPEAWRARMQTIVSFETDVASQNRLETWRSGLDYALAHPWLGAGFEGWQHVNANGTRIDWHNAYIEVMAEHGLVAFGLWLTLLAGSILSLNRLTRTARGTWIARYASMLTASLAAYAAGAVFLGLSYWDILYHLVVIGAVLSGLAAREGGRPAGPPGAGTGFGP